MIRIEMPPYHLRPDLVERAAALVRDGGLLAVPTDTAWAIVCDSANHAATQKLRDLRFRMRGETPKKDTPAPMSLMCGDLASIGTYALMDQPQFRLLKRLLPGPYTVILRASREVPKVLDSKRRTVGVRYPDHLVTEAILQACYNPWLAATCQDSGGHLLASTTEIEAAIGGDLAGIVETQPIAPEPTTVVDYTGAVPILVRAGKGEAETGWAKNEL